jgi:HSP20 family molecular chaperone IbpA
MRAPWVASEEECIMLNRWDPFAELNRLHDQLMTGRPEKRVFEPPVDIIEETEAYELRAELPGFAANQVEVEVDKGILSITGERSREEDKEGRSYRRVERVYGRFARSFSLPDTVDAESIMAEMKDGLLTVRLPKRPAATPRKVTVGASSKSKPVKSAA